MRRGIAACVIVAGCGVAHAYPQDCGLGSMGRLATEATIIVLGEVVQVEVDAESLEVSLDFEVSEVLKGVAPKRIDIELGIPWLTLAPCTGPGTDRGGAIAFLTESDGIYRAVPGDGGVVMSTREEFEPLLDVVRRLPIDSNDG